MHGTTVLRLDMFAFLALIGISGAAPTVALAEESPLGAEIPYFYVREVTSPRPNAATCLVCRYGARPVVILAVRQLDHQTERLLRSIDGVVDQSRGQGLRGFAVFLQSNPAQVQPRLMALARQEGIAMPLTFPIEAGGPRILEIPDDARMAVFYYADKKLVARHIFTSDITDAHTSAVLADLKRLAE
jgi:hypothetical protein